MDEKKEDYKPKLSLVDLEEENKRLKSLLLEATRPLVSQGLITSPGGVNFQDVQRELERTQSAEVERKCDNAEKRIGTEKKKKKTARARSREKSREEKRERERR